MHAYVLVGFCSRLAVSLSLSFLPQLRSEWRCDALCFGKLQSCKALLALTTALVIARVSERGSERGSEWGSGGVSKRVSDGVSGGASGGVSDRVSDRVSGGVGKRRIVVVILVVSLCALLVCLVLLHHSHHSHHMAVLYVHIIPYALLYQIISILKALYADTLQWKRGVSEGVSEGVRERGREGGRGVSEWASK